MKNYIVDVLNDDNLNKSFQRIFLLAELEQKKPEVLINDVIISSISKKFKPRFKDFDIYLENGLKISGLSIKNLEQGKKAWKDGTHGMKNNLLELIQTYGEDNINKEVLKTALQLIKISIDNVYLNSNNKKQEKINIFIQNIDFLYVMLQVAIRIIGIDLYNKGIEFQNKTFGYMTKMMEQEKKKISKMFTVAMSSKNGDQINIAITNYYEMIDKYFEDFRKREFLGNGGDAVAVGGEEKVVQQFGEENVILFIGILLGKLRQDIIKDGYILNFSENSENIIKLK